MQPKRPRHPYYHQLSGLTGDNLPAIPEEDSRLTTCPDDRQLLTTGWPWEGRIELRDSVTMRYRPDTDLVLKGVTLTIRFVFRNTEGRGGGGASLLASPLWVVFGFVLIWRFGQHVFLAMVVDVAWNVAITSVFFPTGGREGT